MVWLPSSTPSTHCHAATRMCDGDCTHTGSKGSSSSSISVSPVQGRLFLQLHCFQLSCELSFGM